MNSINGFDKYQILVLSDYNYELGKIKWVRDHTDLDEFVFLQETLEVKNPEIFDLAFGAQVSYSFSNYPVDFGSYLGKYQTKYLKEMEIPKIESKMDSVVQEVDFNNKYTSISPYRTMTNPLNDKNGRVDYFLGRKNLIIENEYLIKYKGTWHRSMINE